MKKIMIIFTMVTIIGVMSYKGGNAIPPCCYSINNSVIKNSEMKTINLTQGKVALVDDDDFESLNQFKWYAGKYGNTFYAIRTDYTGGKRKDIRMHVAVMGRKWIDHRDHNGLNNQKANLRFATKSQNNMNQRKQANTSSSYKGVTFNKHAGKWMSQIKINGNQIYLGLFASEVDAARAYNNKAIALFCEFANLNEC